MQCYCLFSTLRGSELAKNHNEPLSPNKLSDAKAYEEWAHRMQRDLTNPF